MPRQGHVFLAGALPQLLLRCFFAVCFQRQLSASDLRYESIVLDLLKTSNDEQSFNTSIGKILYGMYQSSDTHDLDNHKKAVQDFNHWIESSDPNAIQWSNLADLMLKTYVLNLPDELLRCNFEIEQATRQSHIPQIDLRKLRLRFNSLFEGFISSFSQDIRVETLSNKLPMPIGQVIDNLLPLNPTKHPDRSFQDVSSKERHPLNKLLSNPGAAKPDDLLTVCSTSLTGRLTNSSLSHAQVRTQEVLLTQEDVMIAIAFQLSVRGFRLLGFTDYEVLLEVRKDLVTEDLRQSIQELITTTANNLLQKVPVVCNLSIAKTW